MDQFDLKVHHREEKTGRIVRVNPYRLHCSKEFGQVYERDGQLFYPNNEPVTKKIKIPGLEEKKEE